MSDPSALNRQVVAISISESPDMPALGLGDGHLGDAMAEVARHLLALGARLVYGGDLRERGFSELLFELLARYRRSLSADATGVTNYLAWPVHILKAGGDLDRLAASLAGTAELVCLRLDGTRMPMDERRQSAPHSPTATEWAQGLTALRETMLAETTARIVLGGRVDGYKGTMPGIGEEALLSLRNGQPLFLMGGFGGCARDIAETIGLAPPGRRRALPGRAGPPSSPFPPPISGTA